MVAPLTPHPRSFIVTHPYADSGVGSNLVSLAGAIWLAQRSGRSVIVDWRDAAVLKDKSLNYFSEFFETPAVVQGVNVYYAPCSELPEGTDLPQLSPAEARRLGDGADTPALVVLRGYHGLDRLGAGSPDQQRDRLKEFYRSIVPRPFVQRVIDRFAADHFDGHFVVGVNVAEGNGMFAPGETYAERVDTSLFSRRMRFLRKVQNAIDRVMRGLPGDVRANRRVFIATDSLQMRDVLLQLSGAVTRRQQFPPPGAGRFFCDYPTPDYTDRDAVIDQIADMYLLARCQALVHNYSVFNLYARVATDGFDARTCEFERLFARYWIRAITRAIAGRARQLLKVRP
jgi:hypothetical protein